jgi:WD40 repeat protein
MGSVYEARDPVLDRRVALKTISDKLLSSPEIRSRFQREAKAAARLQHANIVTIFEQGEVDGTLYIAMELLEGQDLSVVMRAPARLDVARKLDIVIQVCRGLHYAHEHGVLHRDVKPANIRLLPDGRVKIVDFGIARLDDRGGTRTGVVLGTPSYLAPETLRGSGVDHRADQWAVGVLLYELLAGVRPFEAPTFTSLTFKIVHEPLTPLDAAAVGAPAGVVPIVERALAKEPADRFPDLQAMATALARLREGQLTPPPPPPPPTPPPGWGVLAPILTPAPARLPAAPVLSAALAARGGAGLRELALFGEPPATAGACLLASREVLAVAGSDGAVRLWDLRTRARTGLLRTELQQRSGHDAVALALAFSPDGSLLATGHVDGAVHLWDVASGAEVRAKLRHEAMVAAVAFAPDGRTLASGGLDSTLKLWDVAAARAGEARRELHRQPFGVTALCYAGEHLVSGHSKAVLRVLDAQSGRLVATLRGPEMQVGLLVASPDGRLVAVGSHDRTLRVFDLASRAEVFQVAAHRARTTVSAAFLPGGKHLASVALDNALQIWDLETGSPAACVWGQAGESYAGVAVWGSGARLALALGDGRIRLLGAAD